MNSSKDISSVIVVDEEKFEGKIHLVTSDNLFSFTL